MTALTFVIAGSTLGIGVFIGWMMIWLQGEEIQMIGKEERRLLHEIYRDICIAQNAYKHDIDGYLDSYEQRKIAMREVFSAFGMSGEEFEIEDEVRSQIWTRTSDEMGRIKYEKLEE